MPKARNPISVADAARILGKDRKTILRWIESGRIPATKLSGKTGAWLVSPDDLAALMGGEK